MTLFVRRFLPAALVLALLTAWAWALSADSSNRALVFSLLAGTALGIALQRARFCFFCNFRDFVEQRDPRGLAAIIVALGVGAVMYAVIIMAWLPAPLPDRLPPNAHIGPVGPLLAVAAFVFGLGMAVSGSCISAHLYRLGEGSPTAPFALVGAAFGFFLGFLTWNPLWLASVSESPPIWLPHIIGYAGTLAITTVACLGLLLLIFAFSRASPDDVSRQPGLRGLFHRVFVDRWPPLVGGLAVGAISAFYFLRVAPLGVTAELGSLVRTGAARTPLLPETLLGLDTLRGCATVVKETLLSPNGLLVSGLVLGSLAAALAAGQFSPSRPTGAQVLRGLAGGTLMGWGAMTALGCTVGVLLSGIHAGAVSGWVFLVFCALGAWVGIVGVRYITGAPAGRR